MVNIIAHGFEKSQQNRAGLSVKPPIYALCSTFANTQAQKNALLKSKALLERVRGIAPPSPFRKKSILVIEINPQKI